MATYHITTAEAFRKNDKLHPAALIKRVAGGGYIVVPQPGKKVKGKVVAKSAVDRHTGAPRSQPQERPIVFDSFDEALAAVGE